MTTHHTVRHATNVSRAKKYGNDHPSPSSPLTQRIISHDAAPLGNRLRRKDARLVGGGLMPALFSPSTGCATPRTKRGNAPQHGKPLENVGLATPGDEPPSTRCNKSYFVTTKRGDASKKTYCLTAHVGCWFSPHCRRPCGLDEKNASGKPQQCCRNTIYIRSQENADRWKKRKTRPNSNDESCEKASATRAA